MSIYRLYDYLMFTIIRISNITDKIEIMNN